MKIRLQNFQGHADTLIDASKNVTAIIGQSDKGKSSIRRAIKWWRFNRPLGDSFVRNGTNKAIVSIDTISHVRDGGSNYYDLGNGEKPTALKGKVPDELSDVLNIDEVNIQSQHDSIFLLDKTPGAVAQVLSNLIDLSKPQVILKAIKKEGKDLSAEYKVLNNIQTQNIAKLKKYEWLDKANLEYTKLDQKRAAIEVLQSSNDVLGACIENVKEASSEIAKMPSVTTLINTAQKLLETCTTIAIEKAKLDSLKNSIDFVTDLTSKRIPDVSKLLSDGTELVAKINYVLTEESRLYELKELMSTVRKLSVISKVDNTELLSKANSIKEQIANTGHIKELVTTIEALDSILLDTKVEEEEARVHLAMVKQEIGECPLCGGSFK